MLIFFLIILPCGCVRRRLTVRTNPPGGNVFVDKHPIGVSPASTSAIYYGTREFEVVRDGYETVKVFRQITPPWYQIPPLDFITETLWPWEIRDERVIDITMVPRQNPASEVLQARADGLRLQASQGLATPLPPTLPPGADFRNETLIPGNGQPARPIDPTFDPRLEGQPYSVQPPVGGFSPGQAAGNFFAPGGQPPLSIPETGILQGGGYKQELPQ